MVDFGVVDGPGWSRNGVNSASNGEVILSNGTSWCGALVAGTTIPAPVVFGQLDAECYIGSGADAFDIGFISGDAPATTGGGGATYNWYDALVGSHAVSKFTGFRIYVYGSQRAVPYVNGVAGADIYGSFATNSYETYSLEYECSGSSTTIALFRNTVLLFSYTAATLISSSTIRPAFSGASGAIPARFAVRGTPTWYTTIPTLLPPVIEGYPLNGAAFYRWANVFGATSFDYTVDSGTTWTNLPATSSTNSVLSNYITLAELSNDVDVMLQVRSVSTSSASEWSDPVLVTPSSVQYVTHYDDYGRTVSGTSLGSPPVGSTYSAASGVWGITSLGEAYTTTNGESIVLFNGSIDFEAVISLHGSMRGFGFVFRATNHNNLWMAQITDATWQLYSRISGSWNIVHQSRRTQGPATLRVVCSGRMMYFYEGGRAKLAFEDRHYGNSGSSMGYRTWDDTTTRVNSVIVWNRATSGPGGIAQDGDAHLYKGHDTYTEDAGVLE